TQAYTSTEDETVATVIEDGTQEDKAENMESKAMPTQAYTSTEDETVATVIEDGTHEDKAENTEIRAMPTQAYTSSEDETVATVIEDGTHEDKAENTESTAMPTQAYTSTEDDTVATVFEDETHEDKAENTESTAIPNQARISTEDETVHYGESLSDVATCSPEFCKKLGRLGEAAFAGPCSPQFCHCDTADRAWLKTCGPGTVFNPIYRVCDWPGNVGCPPHTGMESGRRETHIETEKSKAEDLKTRFVPVPALSSKIAAKKVHYGESSSDVATCSPQFCKKLGRLGEAAFAGPCSPQFCHCDTADRAWLKTCGPGTVFNPIYRVCDWPYNVIGC
ncbi:unnamed protein product, partial [Auanema sp. JU1783]